MMAPSAQYPVWHQLTRNELKEKLYYRECYFREAWCDLTEIFGDSLYEILKCSATLIIKPDGIRQGKFDVTLDYLARQRFFLVASQPVKLGRLEWRELWRYQIGCATLDRIAVVDAIMASSESILLVLRSEPEGDLPASVRLSRLKGTGIAPDGAPESLREILGQTNRILSLVHTADEPADFVRELGVLLEPPTRRKMLMALAGIEQTYCTPPWMDKMTTAGSINGREFEPRDSLHRIEVAAVSTPVINDVARAFVLEQIHSMERGKKINWRNFIAFFAQTEIRVDPWDLIVLGSHFIDYDLLGVQKEIDSSASGLWDIPK